MSADLQVDLRQVVYALSDALDLVGVDDVAHGKRVGIMAASCGRELGQSAEACTRLFDLGMLHDIGVSTTTVHRHLVNEFDWASAQAHCETGYALLRDFVPLAALAEPIRHHHTRWAILRDLPGLSDEIKDQANLIYLVDRVDALAAPYYAGGAVLLQTQAIRDKIGAHAGSYFSPRLVEAFLAASASEAFWLQLEPRGIQLALEEMLAQGTACMVTNGHMKQLAEIFSRIVDAKSPFTAEHSLGVARLARRLAERMGIAPDNCERLEIAGLLHDLGKLRIPDEILDKPDRLDEGERQMMHAHSYETFQILRHIRGFEEITRWAAYHHEEPDGSGYPFHVRGSELPLEARILRVADIFQAMVQDRPYRKGFSGTAALAFLEGLAAKGRVDAEIVQVVALDIAGSMAAARPGGSAAVNA